ncbi:N-6 DNA methylase [Massilia sp. CCM 8733]|uniref:site-specific DNA-methyltransferase (adenine-specific) n=1 Tax=Massilia mucilaginosa TaxID=2609282 RepID=A0ABX0NWQ8_9BURK|nr:N-6 DNA methylase [Massilia mucilaginosa]NHZ91398.1 N-6 DNA methylase [Massilia mucilaginosa]
MISLQEALGNLVVYYAEQEMSVRAIAPHDLHELAIARAMDTALSGVFRRLGLGSDGPVLPPSVQASRQFDDALDRFIGGADQIAAHLGTAFETIRGTRLVIDSSGHVTVETSPERRGKGIYFTPVALAEAIVGKALAKALAPVRNAQDLASISIIDPAAGCGAFLLAAVRIGADILHGREGFSHMTPAGIRAAIASHCIFGVDIDPLAIATTRALLRAQVGLSGWEGTELDRHLRVADSVSAPMADFHAWFPQVFPAGFTTVITNPPWSKLRPLRHEFFEHMDARVRLYQGTELGRYLASQLTELVSGAWTEHAERTLELSRTLRESTEYSLNREGAGDADLYKYFTERSLALLSPAGSAALLLPSGVLRAQGSAGLRELLRSRGTVTELIEYINKRKLFDIHSMYRFCTVLFDNGDAGGVEAASFGREDVDATATETVALSLDFLRLAGGPDLLIPEVRTTHERDVLHRIYQQYPAVSDPASGWDFCFKREVDMTNDAHAFVPVDVARKKGYLVQEDGRWLSGESTVALLPVYEGRMVHQFDNAAKVYLAGQGRSAAWEVPAIAARQVRPHYLIDENYLAGRGWAPSVRVGYCEISGHANERTLLAALLPANCVCGNKVPVLKLNSGGIDDQLLWLALANSLVVDWIMRRFVSTTVNHFYWQNIPLPTRGAHPAQEALLVEAARLLSCPPGGTEDAALWLGRRALLRATIDVVVMQLYGLTESDAAVVLHDFPKLNIAHTRGGKDGMPLAQLLSNGVRALEQGTLALTDLEAAFACDARLAAAAYTPRDQAKHLQESAR